MNRVSRSRNDLVTLILGKDARNKPSDGVDKQVFREAVRDAELLADIIYDSETLFISAHQEIEHAVSMLNSAQKKLEKVDQMLSQPKTKNLGLVPDLRSSRRSIKNLGVMKTVRGMLQYREEFQKSLKSALNSVSVNRHA